MARLSTMPCPCCGQSLTSREFTPDAKGGAKRATCYEDCLRRCDECELGLSNTKNFRSIVLIHRDPLSNLPQEVHEGVLETLALSLNVINRKSKLKSFCSENSEDAVTWTVFRYLQHTGNLRAVFAELGVLPAIKSDQEPCLLLWGVPVPLGTEKGQDSVNRLTCTIDEIQHDPQSRSEPDVVLDFGDAGVVFIEVKYRSKNDKKNPSYSGWLTYFENTEAFRNPEGVKTTGLYELARNWRIGCQYAGDRPLSLINLGPPDLFKKGEEADLLAQFSSNLSLDNRHAFQSLEWRQLMRVIPDKPRWLLVYDSDRELSVGRMDLV